MKITTEQLITEVNNRILGSIDLVESEARYHRHC